MAISTYKTYLMYKPTSSSSYEKLVDIKDFPDLGGTPEMLKTTTLSDNMDTNIPGIQSVDSLDFSCNYTKADYDKVVALKDTEQNFAVWFGATGDGATATPTGTDGKYEFKGKLSVYIQGGGVNEVVGMKISIAASTPIAPAAS